MPLLNTKVNDKKFFDRDKEIKEIPSILELEPNRIIVLFKIFWKKL